LFALKKTAIRRLRKIKLKNYRDDLGSHLSDVSSIGNRFKICVNLRNLRIEL